MLKEKIRERLELKRVGLEHLEQFDHLLRYVFQVTNDDLREGGYEEGELTRSKRPLLERADVWGWFDRNKLVSLICINPCQVNIHGRIYAMGGLTGVGTYPEYAGMGLMTELIRVSLVRMREQKQWISYLYPYSIPFYRHKGWEIISDSIAFSVKDQQLPNPVDVPGFVERLTIDRPEVISFFDLFAHSTHGSMIRSEHDWEEYWRWENEEERSAALYYDDQGSPTGCLIYWIKDDVFHIKEMIYLNMEARNGLWNFIGAHDSMIDQVKGHIYKNEPLAFYLEDSQIVETIEPYFMGRIVDVQAFLENYLFADFHEPFHFVVTDTQAEWNNGIFAVAGIGEGGNIITGEALGPAVTLNIRTLTALLMNYRRASYFAELEQLKATPESIKMLESVIANQQPYFSDYF